MKPEMSTAVMIERVREMAADSADSQDHVLLTQVANRIELLLAAESGMSREMACIRHALDIPPDQSVQPGVVDAFVRLNAETSAKRWCPDYDQITGRGLFLWIEHPTLGCVPTYGGPYDSYTLPERDADGEFFVHRYDHDEGAWVDDEVLSFHVVDDWLPKNQAELDQYVKDNALTSAERERLEAYDRAAKEPVGYIHNFQPFSGGRGSIFNNENRHYGRAVFTSPLLPVVTRALLRELVDVVWQTAKESTEVPSTEWADELIGRVFPAAQTLPVVPEGWRQWVDDVVEYLKGGLETDGELEAEGSVEAKRLLACRAAMLQPGNPVWSGSDWAKGCGPTQAVPEGWALVPAKATAAMVSAAGRAAREYMEEYGGNSPQVIYQAMLAAAPQLERKDGDA